MGRRHRAERRIPGARRTGDGNAQRAPVRGLAGRLPAHRAAWTLQLLRGVHPHCGFDVQPARQVAQGDVAPAVAAQDRVAELPAGLACLAPGSQRLHPPGSRFHRPGGEQESRGGAGVPSAGRQLPAERDGPLPAQPPLRQRGDRGQTSGAPVADHGRRRQALHRGHRHLAVGQQRPARRARRGEGLLWRRAHAGDTRRRLHSARAPAGAENPRGQRDGSDEAAAAKRAPPWFEQHGFRRDLHQGQARHLCLPCLPVVDPPPDLPPHQPRQHPRARIQGRRHGHHALRHDGAERAGSLPPGDGRHRSPAADRRQGHLPEAAAQGQADRAQAIHRRQRTGHAGNPQLEMEHAQMNTQELIDTARALVAGDKGLLAMDESNPTCNKRFAALGIPQTVEARRAYRELIATTSGLGESISGAILYDETIRQKKNDGTPFAKAISDAGIIPGIKVDAGAKDLAGHPGEKIAEGLDGLRDRLAEYFQMGARFAKWRAVIAMGDGIPSRSCIEANAHALARYAALCQEAGLVPVVEPEVLMDGDHTLERCGEVTLEVLRTVFDQLYTQRVLLEGMILKPNMVLPGLTCPTQKSVDEVADTTMKSLWRTVPAAVPGIAFLSGGQPSELASARLNAMNARFKSRLPWALAFSFARAIQQPALEIWKGDEAHASAAQQALYHRARCNRAARRGEYDAAMERT